MTVCFCQQGNTRNASLPKQQRLHTMLEWDIVGAKKTPRRAGPDGVSVEYGIILAQPTVFQPEEMVLNHFLFFSCV
jgi:hypothetical protein